MGNKEDLLNILRVSRKNNGVDHPKTYKAIYNLVKKYPYYDGYEQEWLKNNGRFLNKSGL